MKSWLDKGWQPVHITYQYTVAHHELYGDVKYIWDENAEAGWLFFIPSYLRQENLHLIDTVRITQDSKRQSGLYTPRMTEWYELASEDGEAVSFLHGQVSWRAVSKMVREDADLNKKELRMCVFEDGDLRELWFLINEGEDENEEEGSGSS